MLMDDISCALASSQSAHYSHIAHIYLPIVVIFFVYDLPSVPTSDEIEVETLTFESDHVIQGGSLSARHN